MAGAESGQVGADEGRGVWPGCKGALRTMLRRWDAKRS